MFRPRPRLAWIVALAADALQLAIFPVFGPGFASPADNVLDVVVALLMTSLLGWNWAFLPTFLVELVPFVDLVPSWTLACWLATRRLEADGRGARVPKSSGAAGAPVGSAPHEKSHAEVVEDPPKGP